MPNVLKMKPLAVWTFCTALPFMWRSESLCHLCGRSESLCCVYVRHRFAARKTFGIALLCGRSALLCCVAFCTALLCGRSASSKPLYYLRAFTPGKLRSPGVIEIRPLRGRAASERNIALSITSQSVETRLIASPQTFLNQLSTINLRRRDKSRLYKPPPSTTHHPHP